MLNNTMGLIFPNLRDKSLPAITENRTMASVPFAGRYRLIDFSLSSMTNAGIQKVGVVVKENYLSLMEHVGTGREWDLSRKRAGVTIFPPQGNGNAYNNRIEALYSVLEYLEASREDYVIMADCDMACNLDYEDIVEYHIANNADVTAVYKREKLEDVILKNNISLETDDTKRVTQILVDDTKCGVRNLAINVFVIGRELLIELIKDAYSRNYTKFESEILARNLNIMKVMGYECTDFCLRISNMKSYFDANIALIDPDNLSKLFLKERPVYTKVRDDAPVIYAIGCKVKNSIVSDGCQIEGEVENCVLFRGVKVGKGAKLKNCVLLRDTKIEENATLEYVVSDKEVIFSKDTKVCGTDKYPVFVGMGARV